MRLTPAGRAPLVGAFLFLLCLTASAGTVEQATVRYVVDGDTVILQDGRSVRLVGINSPEIGHDGAADEPQARAARDTLRRAVEGRTITLVPGEQGRDHYDRLLARLRLPDGRDVDELMLESGLATVVAIPPNIDGLVRHEAAEDRARAARRGIWHERYYRPIAAMEIRNHPTGFHFVRGRVRAVFRGDRDIYLYFSDDFAVMISRHDWRYFRTDPYAYRDAELIAAGWVTRHEGRYRMRVGHPAMLRTVACTSDPRLPGVRVGCEARMHSDSSSAIRQGPTP